MAHEAVINPIISQGYSFDPPCPIQMIMTRGLGPIIPLVIKSIPSERPENRLCFRKSIMGYSPLDKGCKDG